GTWWGWLGFLTVATALVAREWRWQSGDWGHLLGFSGFVIGLLVASSMNAFDQQDWLSYHALEVAWAAAAALVLLVGVRAAHRGASLEGWCEGMVALVAALALGGVEGDPERPHWSGILLLFVSVVIGVLGHRTRQGRLIYASGLLVCASGFAVWMAYPE